MIVEEAPLGAWAAARYPPAPMPRPSPALLALTLALALLPGAGCSSRPDEPPCSVLMDFARPTFFGAPFPSDDLAASDGRISLERYPNAPANPFVTQLTRLLSRDARGFATTGGVFLSTSAPIDAASLPALAASTSAAASVALVDVDAASPELGRRWPAHVAFDADAGPFGAPNLLSIVPLQGVPLPPRRTMAAVATRGVRDGRGRALEPGPEMLALRRGERPATMPEAAFERYVRALDALGRAGVAAGDVVGLAVFTTGDPTAELLAATRAVAAAPLPAIDAAPKLAEVLDGYCVYTTNISMPDFQGGAPPFASDGGTWVHDAAGALVVQRRATSRLVLTVPRAAAPAAGYPLGIMIRTGGGGDRPLVDRGVQDAKGAALELGSGPARELAKVGFAGASADGPHGGPRNVSSGDEQFLMFNVDNIAAIRDNVRQSALETALLERVLEGLTFDASDCPGAGAVRFDGRRVALLGHSMGATVAPLALAAEPRFGAAVLGGAGASWIENLLHKRKPLAVRPLVEILLGYASAERRLMRADPVLSLVQWALEPADPLVYGPRLVRAPADGEPRRHVLVQQGVVDRYIMPTIANALALSTGLDLAGEPLEATAAELRDDAEQTPLVDVLAFAGGRALPLPVAGNAGGATAVVRQYPEDGVQDGHEIMFQSERAKADYRCFLLSFARGLDAGRAPVIPDATTCPASTW
jgi:hypothetical protein